jgi:RNA polymerase sigma-70 factor (ECF subfamily)
MNQVKPTDQDDQVLLQQIQEGCKSAFALLYDKYWEKAYSDAYKRIKDADQAKDIVQEIFTHIWIKRESTRIDNISAYLNVAVRNSVIKVVAKQKLTDPFFSALENIAFAEAEADTGLLWRELLQSYEDLLNSLPPQRQTIFRLRYKDDLTTRDIAAQMGISRKTVQNQLRLAAEQIKMTIMHLFLLLLILHVIE